MKNIIFLITFLLASVLLWAQTNTFPSSGNVGIGTTTPDSKLHIYGGRVALGNTGTGFASGLGIYAGANATNGYVWMDFTSSNVFTIQGGNASDYSTTPIVLQNQGGNVGIGTTTPTTKLEVAGDIRQSGRTTYLLGANANENQALILGGWGIAHGGIYWRGDSRTFTINTGDYADNPGQYGNANLVVTGNVGIGTSSPGSYKLAVEGKLGARKVVVTQNVWADYVFDSTYTLRPLSQVEHFVKTNKHLPDVPSSAEVEKDGLDLGDNQATLLKKIEELTLYLIEQNKRNEEQNKRLQKLTQKVEQQQRLLDALKKQVK